MGPRETQDNVKRNLVRVRISFESALVHIWIGPSKIKLTRAAGQALAVLLAQRDNDEEEPSEVDVFLRGEIT